VSACFVVVAIVSF